MHDFWIFSFQYLSNLQAGSLGQLHQFKFLNFKMNHRAKNLKLHTQLHGWKMKQKLCMYWMRGMTLNLVYEFEIKFQKKKIIFTKTKHFQGKPSFIVAQNGKLWNPQWKLVFSTQKIYTTTFLDTVAKSCEKEFT